MAMLIENTDFYRDYGNTRIVLKSEQAKRALFLMLPIDEIRNPPLPHPWPFNQGYLSLVNNYEASKDLVINLPDSSAWSAMEWLPSILQSYLSSAERQK